MIRLTADQRSSESAAALASHWYLRALQSERAGEAFRSYFLCLEVLSHIAMTLPTDKLLPAPSAGRTKDLEEVLEAAKEKAPDQAHRLKQQFHEFRYQEPTLAESFDRMVALHMSAFPKNAGRLFRDLAAVRNDLMHGRIVEIPEKTANLKVSTLRSAKNLAAVFLREVMRDFIQVHAGIAVTGLTPEPPPVAI